MYIDYVKLYASNMQSTETTTSTNWISRLTVLYMMYMSNLSTHSPPTDLWSLQCFASQLSSKGWSTAVNVTISTDSLCLLSLALKSTAFFYTFPGTAVVQRPAGLLGYTPPTTLSLQLHAKPGFQPAIAKKVQPYHQVHRFAVDRQLAKHSIWIAVSTRNTAVFQG